MKKKLILAAMAMTLLLASCSQSDASPTFAPTDTPIVSRTDTSLPEPTAIIAPTDTYASEPINEETDGYLISTFSTPGRFVPTVTGAMLIDFDSDGDLDLFAAQTYWPPEPSPLLAFRNDGAGNFMDATFEAFDGVAVEADSPRHWAVADFNGDGRDDLFLADQGLETGILTGEVHPGGQNRLFIQNDAGQLIDETATRIPQMLDFTHNTSAGDIDGDGDIDIYVGNWDNPPAGPRFLVNDGAGFFTDDLSRIPRSIANAERPYSTCLLVDVDQDGDLDLFLGSPAMGIWGPDFTHDTLLLNDGAGQFSFAPEGSLPPRFDNGEEVEEVGTSSADFDNDGWPDLIIALQHVRGQDPNKKWIDPALQLLMNNGNGTFRDDTSRIDQDWSAYIMPGHVGGDTLTIDWALIVDFNEDSWPDILTATFGVMSLLFENQEGAQFLVSENVSQLANLGNPEAIIPGDLDGDGDLDFILLYSGSIQEVLLRR